MSQDEPSREREDPTADFLDGVRAQETPWRTDRPVAETPVAGASGGAAEPAPGPPQRWARARAAGRVAGQVAPYVQAAALVGWVASAALGDGSDYGDCGDYGSDTGGMDTGGMNGG